MITAEVAIMQDTDCMRVPIDEIHAGLEMMSIIGGVLLQPRRHDVPYEFGAEHREGVIIEKFAAEVDEMALPVALAVLYTDKALYRTHRSPNDLVYGYAFRPAGLILVSGMRLWRGQMRDDNKLVTAHEAGHVLGVRSNFPADEIHCQRKDCVMSDCIWPEPFCPTTPRDLVEKNTFEDTYLPPALKTLADGFCMECSDMAVATVPGELEQHLQRFAIKQ